MHLRSERETSLGDRPGTPFISACLPGPYPGLHSLNSFPLVLHCQWNQCITPFAAFPAAHGIAKSEKLYKIGKTKSGKTKIG